ncbi:MAG TPA: hypothetical protein VGL20_01360 [Candidatus Dormibacteraeota bacterium]|jgi:hypothetical protein
MASTVRRRLAAVAVTALVCGAFAIVQVTATTPHTWVAATTESHAAHVTDPDRPLSTQTPIAAPPPLPSPAPTSVPVVQRAASAPAIVPAPPVVRRPPAPVLRPDWLTSGDRSLDTGVGVYSDCSGATELTHNAAAIDTCVAGPTYFVGHNAGVFTPLMHMGVGAIITYYDDGAAAHVWRVVSVRSGWRAANGVPPATQPDVVAQFQTCAVPDGSIDRILDVVPA